MSVMDVFMDAALACTVLGFGDHALMLQCDSTRDAMAWTDALRAAALPGNRSTSLRPRAPYCGRSWTRPATRVRPSAAARVAVPRRLAAADHRCDLIDVVSTAPRSLAEVARCNLTTAAVINAHRHRMAGGFSGSAPGFAYLIDGIRACGCRAGPGWRTSMRRMVALADGFSATISISSAQRLA